MPVLTPDEFLRDYVVDGVPASGEHEVEKSEFRDYLNDIEERIAEDAIGEAIIILATGQSNIANYEAFVWSPPANLLFWNADSSSPGTVATAVSGSLIALSYSFAAEIARANPTRTVYVINVGLGSTPIANWLPAPSGTDMYAACKAAVEALLDDIGATKIDHVLFWQGESDFLAGSTTYVVDLQTVWLRFFLEDWHPRETPWTVMLLSERYVPDVDGMRAWNRHLRRWADLEPQYRACVDTSKLAADLWDDPAARIHMTAEGYYVAGRTAYETAFCGKMIGRNATPWQTAYKRASEARQSVAVPAADRDLQLHLLSGLNYSVRGKIWGTTPAAADFKWTITGPTGTLIGGTRNYMTRDASSTENPLIFSSGYPSGQQILITGGDGFFMLEFELLITPTTANGLLIFNWSQDTSTASNTFVFAGSYMELIETS